MGAVECIKSDVNRVIEQLEGFPAKRKELDMLVCSEEIGGKKVRSFWRT
jgi:hypothetical protein